MSKTLNELIEELTELAEDGHGDCEVRLATQPNYPMAYGICEPIVVEVVNEDGDAAEIVFLPEGGQIGYAPRAAFEGGF